MDYTLTVADIISHAEGGGAFDPNRLSGAEPVRRIVGRNGSKADVLFFELDGERVAVKTYAPRSALVRNSLGRWLIRREASAYEAALGVAALPAFLGRLGSFALVTRWVDAEPLRERAGARLDDALFDRLGAVLEELHGRGVALADLHHRDVLLGSDDAIYIVDLATAWVLGRRPGPVRTRLFERFCESDRVNLARMRARFTGGDMDAAVASVSSAAAAWHRRGRRLKSFLDRVRGKR
jgi:tRNA A-37 threonylcarbamoyl transferase component Bud32